MKPIPAASDRASIAPRPVTRPGQMLAMAAILCLVASGGLMWWRHGEEVFTSLVSSALAWCF